MEKTRTGAKKVNVVKKEEAKIVSIVLLEGANEKTDAEVIQYVNIQQNPNNHTDVTHIDRLGQKLRLKVKFDQPRVSKFTVKLESNNNVRYNNDRSSPESRDNYKYSDSVNFITDSNGEKIIEVADKVFVSPAGGNVFTIKAVDKNNNEVTAASKIKTKRLLYYVELNMKNLTYPRTNVGSGFESEFNSHSVQFKKISDVEIDYFKLNLDNEDESIFNQKAVEAFNSCPDTTKFKPYCIGLAYTERNVWRVKNPPVLTLNVDGTLREAIIQLPDGTFLWCNVDNQKWFISGFFEKIGGGVEDILESECQPHALRSYKYTLYDSVKINLSRLTGRGRILLKVKLIENIWTGYAVPNIPTTLTTTKNLEKQRDLQLEITQTVIHEVGHKIELASDGTILDKTPDHYVQNGNHCRKPTSCVMYHAANEFIEFCPHCAITVKKLDLKEGIKQIRKEE